MSVRQLSNGKWQIDYYPFGRKGRRIRTTISGTKEEALIIEKAVRETNIEKLSKAQIPAGNIINDIFPYYLEWYDMHRSPTTYRDLAGVFKNHLKKHFGYLRAIEINLQHIEYYKRIRKIEKGHNRTINKELYYFSGFLRWCEKNGYIKQRIFKIERLPYRRPVPIVLSFDEVVRLINAAEPFYRAFFLCLYSLGLRFSEARYLKVEDIDRENKLVRVKQKGGTFKVLPMNQWLLNAIDVIMPSKGYIFVSPITREPIRDIRRALHRARNSSGIQKHVNPHLLRHSIATHLLGKNINLRTIQQYLGHSQISTTEFYTHVVLGHLKDASNAMFPDT
jgi:site-specific recombinase XerD